MGQTLGILFTMTTYGTWLRGDRRGWVEDGIVYPPDPDLEDRDRDRMTHTPFLFADADWEKIGGYMLASLRDRLGVSVYALTVQRWHTHFVTSAAEASVPDIVKCAKDAVRYGLRPGRPIWTDGYDKRFCFDIPTLVARIRYVERHNTERGRPARPWSGIVELPDLTPYLAPRQ